MARNATKEELIAHKNNALNSLDTYLKNLISSSDKRTNGKADKLSYWIKDWVTFLNFESSFSPSSLRRYKRGEIIKVHLGYNIGSEEGGLHYCVVLDKNNSINSPVVTVVPLTSLKQDSDIKKLHKGDVYLGDELFRRLSAKLLSIIESQQTRISNLEELIKNPNSATAKYEIALRLKEAQNEGELLDRISKEVQRMKTGSIALTNQITTISKIRIYDPKTNHDILSGIKLTSEELDLIDAELLNQFIGKQS